MSSGPTWNANVAISMPKSLYGHGPNVKNNDALVSMDGFCFTQNGLFHDLSDADLETYRTGVPPKLIPAGKTYISDQGNVGSGN